VDLTEPPRLPFSEGTIVRLKGDASFTMVVVPNLGVSEKFNNPFPKSLSVTWIAYRCGDVGINVTPLPTVILEEVPQEDVEKARVKALGGPSLADLLKDLGLESIVRKLQQAPGNPEMDA